VQTQIKTSDWVKAARAGEKHSWNDLYQFYYSPLYATALHICSNSTIAKDLVQDAFMVAYLKLPQLKDTTAFSSWIRKILFHTYYSSFRKKRLNSYVTSLPVEPDSWWEDEINKKFEAVSTKSKLYTLLANLPDTLRTVLLLRYFSNFQSYEEIAAILSVPVGTVRSRLNHAKSKLFELWNEHKTDNIKIFKESEEWNHFYYSTCSGIHEHDDCKDRFMQHLQKNIKIIFPGGKSNFGSHLFEAKIFDDREFGSWLMPTNVVSCGDTSVIEVRHFNSPEHPDHCPHSSILVLHRDKQKADRMHLHI
jgi:RNA polymerase sigma factor (sigma-70 family)